MHALGSNERFTAREEDGSAHRCPLLPDNSLYAYGFSKDRVSVSYALNPVAADVDGPW